jgi:transcriptional regulator GlxA family with amidase domain
LFAAVVIFCALGPLTARGDDAATPAGAAGASKKDPPRILGVVLYPKFEMLDVCGPVEIFGSLGARLKVVTVAQQAGAVASAQGPKLMADYSFEDCPALDLMLVPGGSGTFSELRNATMLDWLRARADKAEIVMSVCSGSAILAKAGLLDGRRATSNKQYFQFAVGAGPKVDWVRRARWVDDGNRVTSSGVSAGIDMALHVVERLWDTKLAEAVAKGTEYQWHRDADNDPFAGDAK